MLSALAPEQRDVAPPPKGEGEAREKDEQQRGPSSGLLYLLGFNAAVGGLLFGYDTGSMSAALLQLKQPRVGSGRCLGLAEHRLSIEEQALVTSFVVLGAFLGSCSAGALNYVLGRKRALLLGSVMFVAGAVLMAASTGVAVMLVARLVVGLGVGVSSHTVPLYISECAPSHLRGSMCFLNDLMIVVGQVTAAVVSTALFYGEVPDGWRYILGFAALPSAMMFVGVASSPESPRWLLSQGRSAEALQVLEELRAGAPPSVVKREYQEMLRGVEAELSGCPAGASESTCSLLRRCLQSPRIRRALLLGCGLQLLQQWSGINTIMYFGASVLKQAGSHEDLVSASSLVEASHGLQQLLLRFGKRRREDPEAYCFSDESKRDVAFTIVLAAAQMVGVILSFLMVDRVGRRPLILGSLCGVTLSLLGIGIVFTAEHVSFPLVIAFVALYLLTFGAGLSPVPWTVNAEIYPQSVRACCISLSTATNWAMNFVVSLTFLNLSIALSTNRSNPEGHPNGVFFFYAAIALVGWVLLWLWMPETKGLSLEQIGDLFEVPEERGILK